MSGNLLFLTKFQYCSYNRGFFYENTYFKKITRLEVCIFLGRSEEFHPILIVHLLRRSRYNAEFPFNARACVRDQISKNSKSSSRVCVLQENF